MNADTRGKGFLQAVLVAVLVFAGMLPAGRYASPNIVVVTQVQAASLPAVAGDWKRLRTKAVQANQELSAGYREVLLQAAISPLATSDGDVARG